MGTYRNGSGGSTVPKEITGLQAVKQRRSKLERAELATAIIRHETKLTKLTDSQIAAICGVSVQYVYQVRLASADAYLRRLQLARAGVIQLAAE
jgi:hypothetical protein